MDNNFTHSTDVLNITTKNISVLRNISRVAVCLLFGIQFYLIVWFNGPQISDSMEYIRLAQESIALKTWYPNHENLYNSYIFSPGFVNYLIVLFKISTNLKLVYIGNLLWTGVLLFSIYFIILRLFNNKTIFYLFSILFCTIPTFWGEVVLVRTEIPYTALAFLSVAVLIAHRRPWSPFIAGIILASANWIRPLALAYLIAMITYLYITKAAKQKYVLLMGGFIITVLCIGTFTYLNFGHFVYQSSTAGVNLIMGANDDADGSYNAMCFQEGNIAYIDDESLKIMTFKEKNTFWKNTAITWILKHPLKWLSLIPAKIFVMYAVDDLSYNYVFVPSINQSGDDALRNYIVTHWLQDREFGDYILIYGQLVYMFYVFGFFYGGIILLKRKDHIALLPLFLIFAAGSAMTIVTIGGPRFHIPYLPIFMIFTAVSLSKHSFHNRVV